MTENLDPLHDPSVAVRAMLDQWLALSNAVAARTLGGPGASPDGTMRISETIGRVLSAVNLPTRAEVLAVGTAVAVLDARLARIEVLLENGLASGEKTRRDAPNAAAGRSTSSSIRSTTMADLSQIKEHANIIGADGVHVGTVDHIEGGRIKLTKNDSGDQHHHWIAGGLVAEVEGDTVRLSANAAVAVVFEEDK